jgi:hypothetical protein
MVMMMTIMMMMMILVVIMVMLIMMIMMTMMKAPDVAPSFDELALYLTLLQDQGKVR